MNIEYVQDSLVGAKSIDMILNKTEIKVRTL